MGALMQGGRRATLVLAQDGEKYRQQNEDRKEQVNEEQVNVQKFVRLVENFSSVKVTKETPKKRQNR